MLDSGEYSAVVSNSTGKISCSCNVKVNPAPVKPSFISKLRDVTVFEGKDVELSAKITGKPEPAVTWFFHGEEVDDSQARYNIVKRSDGRHILKMTALTVEDNGELKCEATNPGGSAVCIAKIAVRGSSKPISPAATMPKFTRQLQDQSVADGDSLDLVVETAGTPEPSVTWFKETKQLLKSQRMQIVSKGNVHSLKIAKARYDDSGTYKVVARNKAGEKNCAGSISVKKGTVLPVIKKGLSKVTVQESETANFSIRVEGTEIAVSWLKDGTAIEPAKNVLVREARNEFELELKNVSLSESGEYECVVKNDAGSVSSMAELVVTEANSPPKFITPLVDIEADEGKRCEMRVEISGRPTPSVKVYKDDEPLKNEDVALVDEGNGVFLICFESLRLCDSGCYSCKATNVVSTASSSANLLVNKLVVPPRFSTFSNELSEILEGEELRIEVLAIGEPQPSVEWSKNNVVLEADENLLITRGELNSLVLCKARPADSGEYQCIAKNSAGIAEKLFKVSVEG